MSYQNISLFILSIFCASQAWAGAVVTYHGRIVKPDGTALEASNVSFKIQVRSPGVPNCLLYEETRSLNMLGSNGMFAIPIGDGNGARTASDPGITVENVFSNNTALNFNSLSCNSGSSYNPTLLDSRRLVVSFDDGSGAGVQYLASMDINYVPLALHAHEAQTALKVGSTPAANVMTVSGPASVLTPSNFTELLALVNGTSSTYAKTSSSVGGDLSGTIASASVVKLQGRAVSSSAPSTNDVLTWNGTSWAPVAPSASNLVTSVAGRTGAITLSNTDISGLGDSATKNVGTSAGTVAAGDDARFGTASTFTGTFAGDVTGTQGATVVSTVGGSSAVNIHNADLLANSATSFNTVSTIVRRDSNGDFTSRDASLRSVVLRDSGSKNITMLAPTTLTNSYSLTWPVDKGSLNQVLTTDASGNLSWTTPSVGSSGTVTSVTTGGAPITVGGTPADPTISVSDATTSAKGVVTLAADNTSVASTVVQATDSRLADSRPPSGSAGGDLSLTYPNPSVSKISGVGLNFSSLTTGEFLKYNAPNWVNSAISSADLSDANNLLKASSMPGNCSAGSTLTFSSPTGSWLCTTIAGLDAGVLTTGTIAAARLPASATYWSAATGGINYSGGNVGIGTTNPNWLLDVSGTGSPAAIQVSNTNPSKAAALQAQSGSYSIQMIAGQYGGNGVASGFVGLTSPSAKPIGFSADSVNQQMTLLTDGKVGIGTTSPTSLLTVNTNASAAPAPVAGSFFHSIGADAQTTAVTYDSFSAGTQLNFRRASGTNAIKTPVQSGEVFGQINFMGYGTTAYNANSAAKIYGGAAETWTDTTAAGFLAFATRPSNVTTASLERMRIDKDGNVGIGTTSPQVALDVAGAVRMADVAVSCVAAVEGSQRYNSTSKKMEFCDGTNWVQMATGSGGSGVDVQNFSSSGTWTKPSVGTTASIECWGGGGSGAKWSGNFGNGGGGGGGYSQKIVPLSSLTATVAVTIGSGGAAVTAGNANGNSGGNSNFGSYMTAYGGSGGLGGGSGGGGGGGGVFGAGSGVTPGAGHTVTSAGGFWGGGNGALLNDASMSSAVWGGGGGGGCGFKWTGAWTYAWASGGSSLNGGVGGAGGSASGVSGAAGSQPGGGGGCTSTGASSGAGGAGYCRITSY